MVFITFCIVSDSVVVLLFFLNPCWLDPVMSTSCSTGSPESVKTIVREKLGQSRCYENKLLISGQIVALLAIYCL